MPVRAVAKVFVILLAEEVARLVRGDDCLCGCDATVVCVIQDGTKLPDSVDLT